MNLTLQRRIRDKGTIPKRQNLLMAGVARLGGLTPIAVDRVIVSTINVQHVQQTPDKRKIDNDRDKDGLNQLETRSLSVLSLLSTFHIPT
jgi:hypothetical protein